MEEDERPQSPDDDEEATRKPTAVERRLEQRVRQLEAVSYTHLTLPTKA